jgi:hypothetical protein
MSISEISVDQSTLIKCGSGSIGQNEYSTDRDLRYCRQRTKFFDKYCTVEDEVRDTNYGSERGHCFRNILTSTGPSAKHTGLGKRCGP